MEIWKDVHGYEGLYKVSNTGKLKRIFSGGKERTLKGKITKDGYIQVILSKNQTKKHCRLHRLIAEAFIPNTENKPQINHKDRNKLNCDASNLEWVTASENAIHCYLTGRKKHTRAVVQYTRAMDFVRVWDSIADASRSLCISEHNICYCCGGGLKTAGGYVWRYSEVAI